MADIYQFFIDMLKIGVGAFVTGYAIHKGQNFANKKRRKR
jgi:hypothetical protein